MKKIKKPLLVLLLLYLIFDLRPLLLIPNLIMYLRPCARYVKGGGAIEMRIFPRLCVAGDPIRVVIRNHDLPMGSAFQRDGDRSGLFSELEFSGSINNAHPVETLYWTCGIGGGLGGYDIHPEKRIWLGDYVHFDRIGRYRINLRYQDRTSSPNSTDSTDIDYNLGDFSIVYLPENPVSKFLKQIVLAAGLFVPSDDVREFAVKWLGYQETAISTYALAKYRSIYEDERRSSTDPYNHSLGETYRGIERNYNFCIVGKILKRFEYKHRHSILAGYFESHWVRLLYSVDNPGYLGPTEIAQNDVKKLIECTYGYLDESSKQEFGKRIGRERELATDEFWIKRISISEQTLAQAKNQAEIESSQRAKQWAEARLADKKVRDLRLRLINYTMTLLEEKNRSASVR